MRFDGQRALIPASWGILFVLRFGFGAPIWALALCMLWIPIYYIGMPMLAMRRWPSFEREFAYRFQQNNFKALLAYYDAQWLLRGFGPKPQMLEKLALIYQGMGKLRDAEFVLEKAVRLARQGARHTILSNLAHIKFDLGKLDEAEVIYRRLLKLAPHLTGAQLRLALIQVRRGVDVEQARQTLREHLGRATGHERAQIEEALKDGGGAELRA